MIERWEIAPSNLEGAPVYSNLGFENFVLQGDLTVRESSYSLANISPPIQTSKGYTFGAAPLSCPEYSQRLLSKFGKISGKKKFKTSLTLPTRAKALFDFCQTLESKTVLGPWYLDQVVVEGGDDVFISGALEPIEGPISADYVRLAASGYNKSLLEQMKIMNVRRPIMEQFEKAFDTVVFWNFIVLLEDMISPKNSVGIATRKAAEIKDLISMISDIRIKAIIDEVIEEVFKNSNYKKEWKQQIL